MNKAMTLFLALLTLCPLAHADGDVTVSDLALRGEIEGENIVFELTFTADVEGRGVQLPLVAGDVAHLDSDLPGKAELSRQGNIFVLDVKARGKHAVRFRFASRAIKDGSWRHTRFMIPSASIRKLSVVCDRDDLEIVFPGALNVERAKNEKGATEVTAFLGLTGTFAVRWKPAVQKLAAELVVACDASTIASANVGALKIDNVFNFQIVQGSLRHVSLQLPDNLNVTQVRGADIQDWAIEDSPEGGPRLLDVTLRRAKSQTYALQVTSEMALPKFPCQLTLPVIAPRAVIRSSGFLMIGTDSAIKLLVDKALGLTQVDQTAFPAVAAAGDVAKGQSQVRRLPSRSQFAYQYVTMPYTLALSADDIVPEYSSEEHLVLTVKDSDLAFEAGIELDIRDAPAREIALETSPGWIVANVSGPQLSDYDVRDEPDGTGRTIHVYFRAGVTGRTLLNVKMERALAEQEVDFAVPVFSVRGARSERGYLVLAAEKGLRLQAGERAGLRDVHTGSVPKRVPGAQIACRFKEKDWSLSVTLERTRPTIHSEILHIVSIGEGVLYGSSAITYHIDGAPVRGFDVTIPKEFQNVEFTGRDVRGWEQDGERWRISLQEKVMGDYTLLATYDRPSAYRGGKIDVGGVTTVATTSEAGYIVLASSASLTLKVIAKDGGLIEIDRGEVPEAYTLLLSDPLLKAFKYTESPHVATVDVVRHETEQILDQVADHTMLSTELSKDGEAVTEVVYSVKNLSRQYLVVTLPEGAQLWSAGVIDEAGRIERVISMREEDRTLIPIHRLLNPNMPVRVKLVYAQSHKEFGALGRTLAMVAPVTPESHSTFAKWTFTIPNGYAIGRIGGNMALGSEPWFRGLASVGVTIGRLYAAAAANHGGILVFLLALVLLAGWLVHARARGRGFVRRLVLGVFLLLCMLFVAVVWQGISRSLGTGERMGDILRAEVRSPTTASVSKTVNLADARPLSVEVLVVPAWLGPRSSLAAAVAALLVGLALALRGMAAQPRRVLLAALGLTILSSGVAALAFGRLALALLFGLALPAGAAARFLGWSHRRGRQCRAHDALRAPARAARAPAPRPPFDEPISSEDLPPFEPVPEQEEAGDDLPPPAPSGDGGNVSIRLLSILALVVCTLAAPVAAEKRAGPVPPQAGPAAPAPVPVRPTMNSVLLEVEAPPLDEEAERSVSVKAVFAFELEEPETFILLPPPYVLTDYTLGSRRLTLTATSDGYRLTADKKGAYEITLRYSVPLREQEGVFAFTLDVPPNLRNRVRLRVPATELEVEAPEAVLLKAEERDKATEALLVFGSSTSVNLSWRPRVRKTVLEKVVYFCEVNTLAVFEPGVVDLANFVRYRIAQGEVKAMRLRVPEGMSVTAVHAPGLTTWRFDPETRLLDAVPERPVSGDFELLVISQAACEGLPYEASLGMLEVEGAARQRGSLAVAVPDTVQIRVEDSAGLNSMNVEDVPGSAKNACAWGVRKSRPATIKRAFRYHRTPVSARVHAARVLPELRVIENGSLSVSDERIVLSSQLGVTVSKAGVFSLQLRLPDKFDVETLTGQDISHWDEIEIPADAEAPAGRGLAVHFRKQVIGTRVINVVVVRTEKGIGTTIVVPRVAVVDALKHTGTLVVSGERGVRMTTVERKGVSEVNPRELGIAQAGVLAFKLLRPEWVIHLRTEVMAPTIRAETLQRVDLSEGMLQGTVHVQYRIDHAGCKTFRVQSPAPGVPLAVTGNDISKVHELEPGQGLWEVELHNKVETRYMLEVRYQIPFGATGGQVNVKPLVAHGVESQTGYLVVMSGGRAQVRPEGVPSGLKRENSRSIPAYFNAGDLSDAILCYRAISGDFQLVLSVVRHEAADVLPAKVDQVRMTSVVSDGGQVLTRVAMNMTVGNLRFLEVTLPEPESVLWSAFVNGKAAAVSKKGDVHRIPLEEPVADEPTAVEFIYASAMPSRWLTRRREYLGPKFVGLPLEDVEWIFYVVPGRRYYDFDGTMEYAEGTLVVEAFDRRAYASDNLRQIEGDRQKAKSILAQGEQLARKGNQKLARKALESAVNYSQNDIAFNEDARIQYRNLAKQQAVVGLVQRRDDMRFAQNAQEPGQMERMRDFQDGNFTMEYAEKIQQALPDREMTSLLRLAERIMDQQSAAERVSQAIRITMPSHGRRLRFIRALHINPEADLVVNFRVSSGAAVRWLSALVALAALLLVYRFLLRPARQQGA